MIIEWIAQHPDVVRTVIAVAGVVILCVSVWVLGTELPTDDDDDDEKDEHSTNPFRW